MKKYVFTILLFVSLLTLSFISKPVFADGMVIKPDPFSDRWDYSDEDSQQAFINYDNGLQKMIVSIGLDSYDNDGVVWLFPVPSDPSRVVIDVVDTIPDLSGEEISEKAKSNLVDTTKLLQMTQIYTIPFLFSSNYSTPEYGDIMQLSASKTGTQSLEQDVVVYEHIDKDGISSEIITAKTANGLYEYLKGKGLKIENGSISVLEKYIGKDYSFVASWISRPKIAIFTDGTENYSLQCACPMVIGIRCDCDQTDLYNQRGVFVTFPTNDIYFPLLPTSVYGSKTVPATIKVIGHVSPKVFQNIKSYTKTSYYIDNYASFSKDLKTFYSGESENIKYTKIAIDAPSKLLTDDLWISKQAPIKTYFSTFVAEHWFISAVILLAISSLLSGIIVGLFVFKGLRKNILKLGLLGLSNCFSILGLIATTMLIGTKAKDESAASLLAEIKRKGYMWKRIVTIILFSVAAVSIIFGLLSIMNSGSYIGYDYSIMSALIIYILPFAALLVGFIYRQIKPEDIELFSQLRLIGYSSWSFKPKDKMKIAFVPIFSIVFLIISWSLVKLIELIV